MRCFVIGIAAIVVGLTSASGAANAGADPTTASVLAGITQAYGGSVALSSIKTQTVVVSTIVSGQNATITDTFAVPSHLMEKVVLPALQATVLSGFDGATAWASDAYGNVEALTGDDAQKVRCQAIGDNPTTGTSADSTSAIKLEASQTVGGKTYLVLSVTPPNCPEVVDFVDPQSYLIERIQTAGSTITLSGFKKGPTGEVYASTIVQSGAQGVAVSTVLAVHDNAAVDPSIFAMPSKPAPTPTAALPAATPHPIKD
jgi:hypothetical protein